jgi:hypothetical protein
LNLLKAVQNLRDCHWLAFKSGRRYAACFSKDNCSLATNLPDFKTEIAPCRLSKVLGANRRHLLVNRSKGYELASYKKLLVNTKAFGTKRLRTY